MAFSESIALSRKLKDDLLLAKAQTAFGKALLSRGDLAVAVEHLHQGFQFNERAANVHGLELVTRPLVDALRQLGDSNEANDVLKRALAVALDDQSLKRLLRPEGHQDIITSQSPEVVRGHIKRLFEPMGGPRFGFLARDDDGTDVYFNERRIGSEQFSVLAPNVAVEAEVVATERGPQARKLRILHEG